MHYYAHHIGDFNSATRHLSRIERSLYRDLIDLYYDTEQPLTDNLDRLSRLIIATSEEETNGLVYVLSEFFTLEADGYRSKRCDEEIAEYHRKADTARANGKKGGRPKQPTTIPEITQPVILANPEETESKANQEPRTINQEPINIKKPKVERLKPECVSDQLFKDWKQHRGKSAITSTVIQGFEREAEKAGITLEAAITESIERNWRGFKADWYTKEQSVAADKSGPMMSDEAYAKLVEETSGGKRNV